MAKELERPVQQPLLERLQDDRPDEPSDKTLTLVDSKVKLKDAVRRDLEHLMNTRRVDGEDAENFPELARSMYFFGIPDISSMGRDSVESLRDLGRTLEKVISTHEPRLEGVRIQLAPRDSGPLSEVRFMVDAMLRLDPSPERVAFDTVMTTGSSEVEVRGGTDA